MLRYIFIAEKTNNKYSGSVPFLLKEHLSYSQIATFALSSYPYSLKLLWSPIVDSVYFPSVGRRKSWIIPMQLIVGTLMLYISTNVERLMNDVWNISPTTILINALSAAKQQCRRTHCSIYLPCRLFCHPRCVSCLAWSVRSLKHKIDIAVDGKNTRTLHALSTDDIIRLGIDPTFSRLLVLCFDLSNYWS